MNDLISRKMAIIQLSHNKTGDDDCDVVIQRDIETIKSLPSAQPEQRWIPCSERLPEPRTDVWCNSDMGQMVGYYEENVETWYGRDYLELMVTAWMPLPEPYKE